jgi:hypothetical protein
MSDVGQAVHATAVVIGEDGILIRGPAGAGKSTLARELIRWAGERGRHCALVSDDRVILERSHGRLIARAVPAIAGLLEIRGLGIVRAPWQEAGLIGLVVDIREQAPRMPEEPNATATLRGIELPLIAVNQALALGVVVWHIGHR